MGMLRERGLRPLRMTLKGNDCKKGYLCESSSKNGFVFICVHLWLDEMLTEIVTSLPKNRKLLTMTLEGGMLI